MTTIWPIWHPDVHSEFGETLRFLGIEVKAYPKALEFIRSKFSERVSIYEVFGDKDILVRVYAPQNEYRRIRDMLETNIGSLTGEFIVEKVLTIWGHQVPEFRGKDLAAFDASELQTAAQEWQNFSEPRKELLKEKHLVIGESYDPEGRETIRSFILIASKLNRMDSLDDIVQQIQVKVPQIRDYLSGLYLGKGTGFGGDILIELGVPNDSFEDIIELIRSLHEALVLIHPSTKTYIAGDITRERIDQCWFIETMEQTVQRWMSRFPSMRSLPLYDKIYITDLCQRWNKWLVLSLTKAFSHTFIEATIEEKKNGHKEKLKNAVRAMENPLEKFLKAILIAKAEEKWGKEGNEERIQKQLAMDRPLARWSLGQFLEAFRRWKDRIDEDALPAMSIKRLQEFLELRNSIAHAENRAETKRPFDDYSLEYIHAIVDGVFQVMERFDDVA